MRRWFIAIFALHFFLSLGTLTLGELADVAPAQPDALAWSDDPAPAGKSSLDFGGAQHGLTDELPDLPDSLPRAPLASKPPLEGGPAIGYRPWPEVAPMLAGLLRPPQALPARTT